MPASAAQMEANRANAQLSTGPRTPEGVAACKLNALKFGLCAADIVIKGEDPAAYDALRSSFIEAYNPANEIEAMLVETATQNWWKMLRVERTEKILTQQLGDARFYEDAAIKKWNNFQRYRNAIHKSWRYALGELKHLVTLRQKKAAAEANFRATLANHIEEQNRQREIDLARIGSVLQFVKNDTAAAPPDAARKDPPAKS